MNLHIEIDGEELSVWQTPTQITYMCLVQPDGSVAEVVRGQKARHAIYIYLQYVKYSLNGVWNDAKQLEDARQNVAEHLKEVEALLKTAKKLEVWVM